jgi:hypothetical protein
MSLYFLFLPLQVAGDTILWKTMDKADTGSYTSTVALVKNFSTGTVIAISGFLIKWTGSYIVAFWFGFGLSSIALVVFFIYRRLMRNGRSVADSAAVKSEPRAVEKRDLHPNATQAESGAAL